METADKFAIDSHKLIYHVSRLHQWMRGGKTYPIYAEVGLSGGCNQRCIFCALDYLKYKPNILDYAALKKFISQAARLGVKSIMYAGEGEPLLHPRAGQIIAFTKKSGIDTALTSNAVMFGAELAAKSLPYLSWFRASINAGCPQTYSRIHRGAPGDFHTVLKNLEAAVKIRNKHKYPCVIGAQFLLIPRNAREVKTLAKQAEAIGLDYLIIKPYSAHPQSLNKLKEFPYRNTLALEKELSRYCGERFKIVFRRRAMEKIGQPLVYGDCLGADFAAFITASGDVYHCNRFFGKPEYSSGNILRQNFREIWLGKKRKKAAGLARGQLRAGKCRKLCRLDEINRYLWELKHPPEHVNFI